MHRLVEGVWRARLADRQDLSLVSYPGPQSEKATFQCTRCGNVWQALVTNIAKGQGCPAHRMEKAGLTRRKGCANRVVSQSADEIVVDISTRRFPSHTMRVCPAGWAVVSRLRRRVSVFGGRYAAVYTARGRTQLVHALLLPGATCIDHVDGDGLNNRLDNLRACTNAENTRNRCRLNRNNASGVPGVVLRKDTGRWSASIMRDRKSISLGCFGTIEEAAAARRKAELWLFGEFAPGATL